ncbi:MAG: 3-ketoacyl-ACP reductase [Verrucomicrobiota bacterium]
MTERPHVLVTGSSRGLGRGIAECLAAAGLSVAIHYGRNQEAALATAARCRELAPDSSVNFPVVGGDLGDAKQRGQLMDSVLEAFDGRLDALVNNAAMAPRQRLDLVEATEESLDEVLNVNLKGPYLLTQLAARHWLANPGASLLEGGYKLIFIGSISAHTASTNRGEYCIAKAGLAMACQLWAARLAGEGITTIELRPGIMATDMTAGIKDQYDAVIADGKTVPQKRWGQPQDVGRAVRAILAGDFNFSTGTVIDLDGGFQMRRL